MEATERILYRLRIYVPHTDAPTAIIRDAADHIRMMAGQLAELQAAYATLEAEHLAMTADRDRLAGAREQEAA